MRVAVGLPTLAENETLPGDTGALPGWFTSPIGLTGGAFWNFNDSTIPLNCTNKDKNGIS